MRPLALLSIVQVNHATRQPNGGKLLCVAGDHEDGRLVDVDTGKPEVILRGHIRNMFATAWHPDGSIIATGNEDNTCRWVSNVSSELGVSLRCSVC